MSRTFISSEFIENPSSLSKHLVSIVNRLNGKYSQLYLSTKTVAIIKKEIKLKLYLKQGWKDYYKFLNKYYLPSFSTQPLVEQIKQLFIEFERFYDKAIFNNFILASVYVNKNQIPISTIIIPEDEKIIAFQKLHQKQISVDQFNKQFGHHALNPYELSSPRFKEYQPAKLLKLAKLSSNIKTTVKSRPGKHFKSQKSANISTLIALREIAKDKTLLIIDNLRDCLLKLQKQSRAKNIFNLKYQEILRL